ncbi:MAG TPA: class I SAM-dependent methyltransferase [Acidimicrobiales bacterium]
MTESDRTRWDDQHAAVRAPDPGQVGPPRLFADQVDLFPTAGTALEVACGNGTGSVWLAERGLTVTGLDVSTVAIERATVLAERVGVAERCHFLVQDLDQGLPDGPPVDVVLCHMFRDPALYPAILRRLGPGGLLAMAVQSEADVGPGRYKAPRGELTEAFATLEPLATGESGGFAWFLGRRPA